MDNGRLNITEHKGLVFCDAYLDDEWSVEDVQTLAQEICKNFAPPADVIIRKAGSYSVSTEAQSLLASGIPEFKRVVYVVEDAVKRASAEFAKTSYMKPYNVAVVSTLEEAHAILKKGDQ